MWLRVARLEDIRPPGLRDAQHRAGLTLLADLRARAGENAGLHTSVSHDGRWVVAVADADAPIGVDIVPSSCPTLVAERFFSPAENKLLRSVPCHERPRIRARLWAAKEAWAKCDGAGLRFPLVDVTDPPRTGRSLELFSEEDGPEVVIARQTIPLP
jgi:phosphopantetheinyl transferase